VLNFFNRLREHYVINMNQCDLNQQITSLSQCNDFTYSMMIASGIGYIFLGNIYDNIEKPR